MQSFHSSSEPSGTGQASGPIRRLEADLAEPCVFAKQSLPPGLCPPSELALRWGLLLPKVRRQFAEFLQDTSLKRLGILYHSTCVGLGYGLYGGAISWDSLDRKSTRLNSSH